MTISIFIVVQSIAAVWWASAISVNVREMRLWQDRQDDRLQFLEGDQRTVSNQMAVTQTLLNVLRKETSETAKLIIEEVQRSRLRFEDEQRRRNAQEETAR